MSDSKPSIAVVGGTGALGGGLAWRWAKAGRKVIVGSRGQEKAEAAAAEIKSDFPDADITGLENAAAAAAADVVVLTVPFSSQAPNLEAIRDAVQGKVLVDCTVPLVPPKVARVQMPEAGSAAVMARDAVGEGVDVTSAFHNVGASHLRSDHDVGCDVLVFGDKVAAREVVVDLVEDAGMTGWHAGPLVNSAAAEAMTSVLIGINKRYKIPGSGLRITGEPKE